jgi:cytochrome c oxidase cbb3-type subunit 4
MFKYLVEQLPGSDLYAIVSLVIFFSIFIGVLVMIIRADKEYLTRMERMPLDSPQSNGDNINGYK